MVEEQTYCFVDLLKYAETCPAAFSQNCVKAFSISLREPPRKSFQICVLRKNWTSATPPPWWYSGGELETEDSHNTNSRLNLASSAYCKLLSVTPTCQLLFRLQKHASLRKNVVQNLTTTCFEHTEVTFSFLGQASPSSCRVVTSPKERMCEVQNNESFQRRSKIVSSAGIKWPQQHYVWSVVPNVANGNGASYRRRTLASTA